MMDIAQAFALPGVVVVVGGVWYYELARLNRALERVEDRLHGLEGKVAELAAVVDDLKYLARFDRHEN